MKTKKNISDFLPRIKRAACVLHNEKTAQYHVFHGKRYTYIVYLTRVQGDCDKMWKIICGKYLRYREDVTKSKNKFTTEEINNQIALRVAEELEPTIITYPIE